MNAYMQRVLDQVKARNAGEDLFIQTVEEVFKSIENVVAQHPEYEKAGLLERMCEPERAIEFRVTWADDQGERPCEPRLPLSSSTAPSAPTRAACASIRPSIPDIIKFLGFEQTFKNSLTGLPIGGGKGGCDFDPRGKSDAEIMRFCQAFMTELYRHIGPGRRRSRRRHRRRRPRDRLSLWPVQAHQGLLGKRRADRQGPFLWRQLCSARKPQATALLYYLNGSAEALWRRH